MNLPKLASSLLLAATALTGCGALVDSRADRREAAAVAAYPPEGQFLEVDGRRVHYVQEGSGPDLVLLHGASGNTRDFTFSFVERVSDDYRVTVFDRPGLGYTDRIDARFGGAFNTEAETPREQAVFLNKAARQLGIENEIVLGQSYGGAVAMAWGLEADPAALVIVSGATMPWKGQLGALYGLTASPLGGAGFVPLLTAFAGETQVRGAVETIFEPQDVPEGYLEYVGWPLSLRRESFRANARQVNSLKPAIIEQSAQYRSLTLPIEVVHGTEDDVVPDFVHAENLASWVESAQYTPLPGIGHMAHQVAGPEVVAAIDRAAARAGIR